MIFVGVGIGLLVVIGLIILVSCVACGGESGRRERVAQSLTQVMSACTTAPNGSGAAWYAAPAARARLQPILCQVTQNTIDAVRNAERTPEYGVEGAATVEPIVRASGVTDVSRCSIFQNDDTGQAMVVGCAMNDPATGEDALFLVHVANPAMFTP